VKPGEKRESYFYKHPFLYYFMKKSIEKKIEAKVGVELGREISKEVESEVKKEVEKEVKKEVKEVQKEVREKVEREVEKEIRKRFGTRIYEETKKSAWRFQKEFKEQAVVAITAAFAFLIALSWRTPIQNSVDLMIWNLGLAGKAVYLEFISAIVITLIAVLILMLFSRWRSEGS